MLDYGIVGNCKTCALVRKNGSIEWMCFPTFSSPSIFAKILDENKGGFLRVQPVGKYTIRQRYVPNTAILETTFESKRDAFQIFDFFPRYRKLLSKRHEKLMRQNRLLRVIKRIKGKPKFKVIYQPKPNYALEECNFREKDGNLLAGRQDSEVSLISNIPYQKILNGESVELKKTRYLIVGKKDRAEDFSVRKCNVLLNSTKKYWEKWVSTLVLPQENRKLIIRSAITLKLLTYSQTGAIIAAPTTSIPEEIGSPRTWDYRYCWIRDSVFCADALKKIGRRYEAKKLLEFFVNRILNEREMQIMYGIHGETQLTETELSHLDGFKGSKPVRIGNAAYDQIQHDIYGEMIDLLYLYFVYYRYEKKMKIKHWRFLKYLVKQIKKNWKKQDSGIWEFRGLHDHYVHSKLMCYVGVDRAIKIAQHYGKEKLVDRWLDLKEAICQDILQKGYNKKAKAFTISYGRKELDAAILLMAYHEFLDANDPRLISTVKEIYEKLRKDFLVQRYTIKDDFGKSTSAFTICAFWLVNALWYIGEEKKAREIFRKLVRRSNHLGLFSEDIDIKTKKLIGNFPQAYTHIALINSSILLSEWSVKRKQIDWSTVPRKEWF